jgi:dTDP-L-rhamnose 4-epimerase
VYAATKLAQEHVLRAWGLALAVPTVVLRLQNVYGPGQSPTNPYTGILPLFARRAAAGEAIPVYEDGAIVRDFVHVDDVSGALVAALTDADVPEAGTIDIGSGVPVTILDLARRIARRYGAPAPVVTGQFRDGDVRFACADPALAGEVLGWEPRVGLDDGLDELCRWLDSRP